MSFRQPSRINKPMDSCDAIVLSETEVSPFYLGFAWRRNGNFGARATARYGGQVDPDVLAGACGSFPVPLDCNSRDGLDESGRTVTKLPEKNP